MKNSNELAAKPKIENFTVSQLRDVESPKKQKSFLKVPVFQRWIVPSNKKELEQSISLIGMMRCPVIALVKEENQHYIIDGNHLREVIVNDKSFKPDDKIACIYTEVETFADAAEVFKLLNTKGRKLDWVDTTNLYMHVKGPSSVYADIWALIGNPKNIDEVYKIKGFTLNTIIEILCKDKKKYSDGDAPEKSDIPNYLRRKTLLIFLLAHANDSWDKCFGKSKDSIRPSGAAIIGAMNAWFRNDWHKEYDDSDFLESINNVYINKKSDLKNGIFVINRDNAGRLLEDYMSKRTVNA